MKRQACAAGLTDRPACRRAPVLPGQAARRMRPGRLGDLMVAGALLISGCGSPGSPQPPSLKLPTPPGDLTITRTGDAVALSWTMPRRASDRAMLVGDQRAVICRTLQTEPSAPCAPVGSLLLAAGTGASYTDVLPQALLSGPPRLLTYTVRLENHQRRSVGPSSPAYTAAGAAPPDMGLVQADTEPSGVVLRWQSSSGSPAGSSLAATYLLRLRRTRMLSAAQQSRQGERLAAAQPLEQTLEVQDTGAVGSTLSVGWKLDHATDRDAALNYTYRYTVARVSRVTLGGHQVEVSGLASAPVTIEARDVFPPRVPERVEAVADRDGGAIDLSWTPNADVDLAGYRVYRRQVGTASMPLLVSGAQLVGDAAWRDVDVHPGLRYEYSVTAVDTSGNESARSPGVEEGLEQ